MVQKTRTIKSRKKSNSESSPYWDWIHNSKVVKQKDNDDWEPAQANPDMLPESAAVVPLSAKETEEMAELIREALELLSPQQRKVVETMAEGRSFTEAAKFLNMSQSTLENHLVRARKKIVAYVGQNRD